MIIESVTLNSNSKLTTINDYAFRNCINLKEIHIPKSLKKIDFKKVFENCKEIKIEIEEENEYYKIEHDVYSKNESGIISYDDRKTESYYSMSNEMTTIEIKEGITKIGDYSMKGLSKVTEITNNKTIERIGMNVFEDCISLSSINVDSENEYLISNEGILFNKDKTELIQYPIRKSKNKLYNTR